MAISAERISRFLNSDLEERLPPPLAFPPEEIAPELPRELNFGLYLRRERILRGITRDEVIQVTKVSPKYLEAIEGNRLSELPPKAFVVGFLRVFSDYAGLNGDEVVNRYLTELAKKEAYEEAEYKSLPFWKRHIRKFIWGMGAVCLLCLMFAPLLRRPM